MEIDYSGFVRKAYSLTASSVLIAVPWSRSPSDVRVLYIFPASGIPDAIGIRTRPCGFPGPIQLVHRFRGLCRRLCWQPKAMLYGGWCSRMLWRPMALTSWWPKAFRRGGLSSRCCWGPETRMYWWPKAFCCSGLSSRWCWRLDAIWSWWPKAIMLVGWGTAVVFLVGGSVGAFAISITKGAPMISVPTLLRVLSQQFGCHYPTFRLG